MNKKTLAVLTYIAETSKEGEAVIIDKEELLAAIPAELKVDECDLEEILKELELTEMVKIKYRDEASYCLLPSSKGKLVAENEKTDILSTSFNLKIDYKRIGRIAFWGAFLGAMLAGLIFFLLGLIWD